MHLSRAIHPSPLVLNGMTLYIDFISLSHMDAWIQKYDDNFFSLAYEVMSAKGSPIKQKKRLAAPISKYMFSI